MPPPTYDYDYLVVGSGFGGSVSALRLSEKGYRVGVLERGRRWQASDFAKTNWDAPKSLWVPALKWFGILRLTVFRDVFVLSGAGVGGGSLVYANTLYIPPDAFFEASQWAGIRDWKAQLMPFYRQAQFMLGVTQNEFEGEADRILADIASDMGRGDTYVRTPVGVYFGEPGKTVPDPYFGGAGPDRSGCTLCGGCMVGCRHGAKNTLDRNYLYFAEKLGAEVHPMRTVVDVRPLPDGGYEVEHVESGAWFMKDRRVTRAKNVVLSAGVLGTVNLLLQCKERGSLPNLSDQLGKCVRTNSEAILGASTSREGEDWSRGIAITSSMHPDEVTHVEIVRYSEGSDAMASLGTLLTDGGPGMPRWLRFLGRAVRRPVDLLRSMWPFGRAKKGVFLLVMQTLDNSISLRLRRSFRSLFRRVMDTDRGEGPPNPTYIPAGNEVARSFAKKADGLAYSSILEVTFDIPTTAHILGGACIGESRETGVIDESGQVFGHPGLYVCDGSMIPANLGVNPSLTITALAEHVMSQVPVREGTEPRHAIDPALVARRVREIEALAEATGSPSLQRRRLPMASGG